MHIVLVHVHVKPEHVDAFITATIDNATNSAKEEGILRFDFLQQADDPNRFTLYEVYKDESDQHKHRETAHFLRWRDTVWDMFVDTRQLVTYKNIFPDESGW